MEKVDLKDGLLAPDDAPDEFVETRAFLTRDPIYDPSKNNGIVPEDWDQMVPSQKTTTDYEELAKKKEEEEKKKKEEEEKKKKEEEDKKRRENGENPPENPDDQEDDGNILNSILDLFN